MLAACAQGNTAQPAPTASPAATSAPSAAPMNIAAADPPNCAQPPANVTFVDAYTGKPIVIAPNERLVKTIPPFSPQPLALAWVIQRIKFPFTTRVVYPRVPAIIGKQAFHIHDEATIEILPAGKLADDEIQHIQFVADRANNAPPPSPAQATAEAYFNSVEATQLQALVRGTPPDDSPFENDDGDPNFADPHTFLFACKFLESRTYTMVLRVLRRHLVVTPAYQKVQQRLDAENATNDQKDRVGWAPDAYVTYVARNVTPSLATYANLKDDGLDAVKNLAQSYNFQQVASIQMPTPTPAPSGVVTP
jgi:hypothetical protein